MAELGRRRRDLWWRPSVHQEVTDELEFHVAMRARELIERGWDPADARREAERRFQSAGRIADECRAIGRGRERERRWRRMRTSWRQDLRYAVRAARRAPGFTLAVVATLALGIGATTAIFTVVNAVLLKPLPFAHADRVVALRQGRRGTQPSDNSAANYLTLARENQTFAAVAAHRDDVLTLQREGGEPIRAETTQITSHFFDVVAVEPVIGRLPDSVAIAGSRVVVLSERFWRSALGSDPGIIGSTVQLGGKPATIVAVIPSLRWPSAPELWISVDRDLPSPPIQSATDIRENYGLGYLRVVARIKDGMSPAAVQVDLDRIAHRLETLAPKENEAFQYQITKAADDIVGSSRGSLMLLLGAVGLVLAIAAANVANLLLARGSSRSRELAVRAAIGADRGRLVRQLLTESVGLALVGGALGLAIAWGLTPVLARMAGTGLPRLENLSIDFRVLGFALGISVATGLVFGLWPALHQSSVSLADALRSGGRIGTTRALGALRGALVIGELALAVIVVIGAALLTKSLVRLQAVDPGFATERVTAIEVSLTGTQYPTDSSQIRFYDGLLREVGARLPRAQSSLVFPVPFGGGSGSSFTVRRQADQVPADQQVQALIGLVSTGFFRTIGIPLASGRDFLETDRAGGARVAVISAALAKRLFPNEDPLGRPIYVGFPQPFIVVGVAADVRSRRLDQVPEPTVYVPYRALMLPYLTLLVRSADSPDAVLGQVRSALRALDPAMPLGEVRPLTQVITDTVAAPRFRTWLLGGFALLGLVLGAIGVYGLLSYLVNVRRRDLAIQLALGASPARAVRETVASGVRLAALGIGLGVAASAGLSRLLGGLLYGVAPRDPSIFIGSAVGLGLVALLASYLPARRAARIDPLAVLRQD